MIIVMRCALALWFLLLGTAAPAAEVALVLDEASILPGTPTGLSVIVTNPLRSSIEIPESLWLTATRENGDRFLLRARESSDRASFPVPSEMRSVPAGQSREFRFDPAIGIIGSPWLLDARLSSPGRYRLRAILGSAVSSDGSFDPALSIASPEVELAVRTNSVDDAIVWQWMQKIAPGGWGESAWLHYPGVFSEFVMRNSPKSGYALYAAVFLPMRETGRPQPQLAEQAARFPNSSFADQVRLLIAQYHLQAADIERRSDLEAAASDFDAARRIAADLVVASRSSAVRSQAKDLLVHTPTREQILPKAEQP